MRIVQKATLIDIIKTINNFDKNNDEHVTIYLEKNKDWKPDSKAVVIEYDNDEEGEWEVDNFIYFLEVSSIKEWIEALKKSSDYNKASIIELSNRIIQYAKYDA